MNEAATLSKYYKERIESIEFILQKSHGKFSTKAFHKLRVEIKRIKALVELIHFCSEDFKREKFLKLYRKIFRKAGEVRELQLVITILRKLEVSDLLMNYDRELKKALKKKKNSFFSLVQPRLIKKLVKSDKRILPFFEDVNKIEVKIYLEIKRREIERITNADIKKEQIHELRKLLKRLYDTLLLLGFRKSQFEAVNDFQVLLGQWHDDEMMLEYLQKALVSKKRSSKEISNILLVKQKVSSESERLFNAINLKILDFQVPRQTIK